MNRTDRLYAIVEELRGAGPRGRTAAALADRFEVAARTVKRDVSALQQAGVPIWSSGGPGGGYVLDAAATLPPLTFTAGEATAVAVALGAHGDLPYGPDGRAALAKLLGAMRPDQRAAAADLAGRVWVRAELGGERPPWARVVEEALRLRRMVVLDYRAGDGGATRRRPVEPMAIAHTRGRWYLLGWCRMRRGGRWFRFDRMEGATLTTEPAPARNLAATFGEPPADAAPIRFGPHDDDPHTAP